MTGIPREVAETGSQPPSDFVHEDDLEAALASWARCIQDKISFSIEYRVKKEWHGHDHLSGEQVVGETWFVIRLSTASILTNIIATGCVL